MIDIFHFWSLLRKNVWVKPGEALLCHKIKTKAALDQRLEAAEAEGCAKEGDDSLRKASLFARTTGPQANSRVRVTAWQPFF